MDKVIKAKRQRCASCRCKAEWFSDDGYCGVCERFFLTQARLESAIRCSLESVCDALLSNQKVMRAMTAKAAELAKKHA